MNACGWCFPGRTTPTPTFPPQFPHSLSLSLCLLWKYFNYLSNWHNAQFCLQFAIVWLGRLNTKNNNCRGPAMLSTVRVDNSNLIYFRTRFHWKYSLCLESFMLSLIFLEILCGTDVFRHLSLIYKYLVFMCIKVKKHVLTSTVVFWLCFLGIQNYSNHFF